jgi:hypothetical protein
MSAYGGSCAMGQCEFQPNGESSREEDAHTPAPFVEGEDEPESHDVELRKDVLRHADVLAVVGEKIQTRVDVDKSGGVSSWRETRKRNERLRTEERQPVGRRRTPLDLCRP